MTVTDDNANDDRNPPKHKIPSSETSTVTGAFHLPADHNGLIDPSFGYLGFAKYFTDTLIGSKVFNKADLLSETATFYFAIA